MRVKSPLPIACHLPSGGWFSRGLTHYSPRSSIHEENERLLVAFASVNLASVCMHLHVCQSAKGGSVFTIQSYISGKITGKLEVFSSQIIWIWWKRQREDITEHSFLEAFIRLSPWFPQNVRLKPAWEAHKKGKERGSSSTQERERRPRGAQAGGKRKHLTPRQPRPFPSCLEPLFQSEATCNVIDMKMIIFSCKLQERFCT